MLSVLLLLPLFGACVIVLCPRRWMEWMRAIALSTTTSTFLYACHLFWGHFAASSGNIQLIESHIWHLRLGAAFALGVDGLSVPLVLLETLLMVVAVLASRTVLVPTDHHAGLTRAKGSVGKLQRNHNHTKLYYVLLLILESAMLGVFMARDWLLFYLFWESTLIPLFLLIERMGGANRQRAALNFFLYTMGGSVFILIAILVLCDTTSAHSFDMGDITAAAQTLPPEERNWIFLCLLLGFGVKMPIFPLHGWLPLAHVEAPSPVSILLSGILLKMGAYGLLRAVATLPTAVIDLQIWLVLLAFVNMIYGAVLAWSQRDLKTMVAYGSVSHMGIVLLGIATLNQNGLAGAVVQMVAHGLTAGALFLLVGLLYERTHTRDIADYSALVQVMPRCTFFIVITLLAAVGLPGTAGFVAELHVLVGSFAQWGAMVALLSVGMLISAAYALRTIGRFFTGTTSVALSTISDLTRSEMTAAAVLLAGVFALGLYPAPGLMIINVSVMHLSQLFSHT